LIRTRTEEPCQICGKTTNAYDEMVGRVCPKCLAVLCAKFGKSLEMYRRGIVLWSFDEEKDMDYLAYANRHLLQEQLVDHSEDIDANL